MCEGTSSEKFRNTTIQNLILKILECNLKATEKQIEYLIKNKIKFSPEITVREASVVISAFQRANRMVRRTNYMRYQSNYGTRGKNRG